MGKVTVTVQVGSSIEVVKVPDDLLIRPRNDHRQDFYSDQVLAAFVKAYADEVGRPIGKSTPGTEG